MAPCKPSALTGAGRCSDVSTVYPAPILPYLDRLATVAGLAVGLGDGRANRLARGLHPLDSVLVDRAPYQAAAAFRWARLGRSDCTRVVFFVAGPDRDPRRRSADGCRAGQFAASGQLAAATRDLY